MKHVTVNWSDLKMAFEDEPDEFGETIERVNYFDKTSGKVVFVDELVINVVGSIIDELDAELAEDAEWTDDLIRGTDTFGRLSELEKPSVLAAVKIEYADSTQFERIPHFDSHDTYELMRDFAEAISDELQRSQLCDALEQRKPFHRFRDVLADDRRLQRQWREFELTRQHSMMIEWLHSIGIEPANPDMTTYDPPPLPNLRKIMLAEVEAFVRIACQLEGVKQIALIGSLTTDREFPKDIDLLITVNDACDLAPLAKLGRQLSGRMGSHQAGADVFLANEDGNYLGRTCPWKNFGPGHRASCDALQCGARNYLHDDFGAICFEKKLIFHPPVVLWPDPVAAPNVASDIRELLIEPLLIGSRE